MGNRAESEKDPNIDLRCAIEEFEQQAPGHTFVLVGGIDDLLPAVAERECARAFGHPHDARVVNVILDSGGGSPDAAYQTMLILRRYASVIRVWIPRWAKSAATLLSLGANEVFLSPFAQLGPLDTQVVDPRNPATRMSALDGYQSVEYIRDYALSSLSLGVTRFMMHTRASMPLGEIVDHVAGGLMKSVVSPVVAQVRPLDFGSWARVLRIGYEYATRLLVRYAGMSIDAAETAADRLVYDYPHHGFVIDTHEAQAIGLSHVRDMPIEMYQYVVDIVDRAQRCDTISVIDGAFSSESGYKGFAPGTDKDEAEEDKMELEAGAALQEVAAGEEDNHYETDDGGVEPEREQGHR